MPVTSLVQEGIGQEGFGTRIIVKDIAKRPMSHNVLKTLLVMHIAFIRVRIFHYS